MTIGLSATLSTALSAYMTTFTDTTAHDTSGLAIADIDTALDAVNSARSQLGAQQNRLEHNAANLRNVSENISASRSRILDTDFAAESAELARTNVLQQAGMAMLSQANQSGQQVMSLLK